MSGFIMEGVKYVGGAIKTVVIDRIKNYVNYVRKYEENIGLLRDKLNNLGAKKLDIQEEVKLGKDNLEKITSEAAFWLEMVRKLTVQDDLKKLARKDFEIAKAMVKLIEVKVLKKILKEDREMLGIVAKVLKMHNEEEYKKVAEVVVEVMKDTSEEIKKLIKEDTKMAVVAIEMLKEEDLQMLVKGDEEMAEIMRKAEEMSDEEIWWTFNYNDDEDEESKLLKHVDKNAIERKIGGLFKYVGNFVMDEKFMKDMPEGGKLGLQFLDAFSKRDGWKDQMNEDIKRHSHRHCRCCSVFFQYYCDRHDLSLAAEIMVNEIDSILNKLPGKPVTRPTRSADLKSIPNGFLKGLESREQLLQEILKAFSDDKVHAVGLFGMGGSGKTTLAKEVYNKAKSLFDTIIKVEISEAPNIERIQGDIAEAIGLSLHDKQSLRQRATMLYNRLKLEKPNNESNDDKEKNGGKKVLIILDNTWHKLNLDDVGIPRQNNCCKLLVTTREEHVCKAMNVQDANTFKVGMLIEKEARDLFQTEVGIRVDSGGYKAITKRLLDKCGGLPLTIVATANAIKGKDLSMWRHFADELEKPLSSQVNGVHNETYSILKTSYKVMENEEKKMFFLLVCLSPVGSSVSIEDLMRYGIGLNLFQYVNKLSEAMEQTRSWVEELISSSMLLQGDTIGHVKIHDVVRASAISFAAKDKHMFLVEAIPRWMCEETFNKYTAISLLSGQDYSRLDGVKADLLRILLLKGNLSSFSELSASFFQGMPNLQVLVLSNMNLEPRLPESIGELKNLKTLHLERCKLGDISLIGKLFKLLVLSLRGSILEELPDEMGKLRNLRLLDMGGCKVNRTPANKNVIASLSCLEGLHMFDNFNEWAVNATELDGEGTSERAAIADYYELLHLNALEVHVQKLEYLPIGRFAKNLDKFKICVSEFSDKLKRITRPLHRVLEFGGADLDSNSGCLEGLLKRADCVKFNIIRFSNNLVPELDREGFRELKYLNVKSGFGLKCVINTDGLNDLIAFPNLEYLKLCYMNDFEMICDGKAPLGTFSNLQHLELRGLDELRYVLPFALLPPKLTEIKIDRCQSLKYIFVEPEPNREMDVIELPLKSLDISRSGALVSILGQASSLSTFSDSGQVGHTFFDKKIIYPSLELLRLDSNDIIVNLWSKELDISRLQNLKVIEITYCGELRSLGWPSVFSAFVHLEKLSIEGSGMMQEVISKETDEHEIPERIIKCPELIDLKIRASHNLECFYGGSYKLDFPKLKKLELCHLSELTVFAASENSTALFSEKVEFPYLEELEVVDVIKVMRLWNWRSTGGEDAPKLKKLTLDSTNALRLIPFIISQNLCILHLKSDEANTDGVLFSTSESSTNEGSTWTNSQSQLPKLEELCIKFFPRLEKLFENEDDAATSMLTFCGQLRRLELEDIPELSLIPLHLFKNLRSFHIKGLKWKYVFPSVVVVRGLEMLEDVQIRFCHNMEVIIQDEIREEGDNNRTVMFPRLKTLTLERVSGRSFSSRPDAAIHLPSLETLKINSDDLEAFWSGPFIAPKLKEVEVDCWHMKWFLSGNPNQVVELPSLQRVNIAGGHDMHSFSSRPLIAPNLREVMLDYCEDLQWFLPGNPNHDDVLELPHLETVHIGDRGSMTYMHLQSFSSGPLLAPKLTEVRIYNHDYSIQQIGDLNDTLRDLYESKHKERDESGEESEEDWRDEIDKGEVDLEDSEDNQEHMSEEGHNEGDCEDNEDIQEDRSKIVNNGKGHYENSAEVPEED